MTLREKRCLFTSLIADLIHFANHAGYEVALHDVFTRDGHCKNSYHYRGLAADLNLYKNGDYLRKTEDHAELGEYWKSLHPMCTWGGDFRKRDGNHYSFGEGK